MRDWLWRKITIFSVKATNKIQPRRAPSSKDAIRPILIEHRYRGLAGAKMFVSENTPKTERPSLFIRIATRTVLWLKDKLSLTFAYPELWNGDPVAFPKDFLSICPAPVMPEDLKPGANTLEGFARRGPYSMYLKPDGGDYIFDFKPFEQYIPRDPYIPVGGVARFEPREDGTMRILSIEFGDKKFEPSDTDEWRLAEIRIICALNSYSTFVDHLTHVHLCGSGIWSLATFLSLSAEHPLRILMQPFIVETMRVNNDNIDGLIKTGMSNVPCYTGYPLELLNKIMKDSLEAFDVCWLDAERRRQQLGQEDGSRFPTMQSAVDLWKIFHELALAWCHEYLHELDTETRTWVHELDARVPNGITKLIGITDIDHDLTVEHVARIATVGMFTESVWHFTVANMVRDYELFADKVPTAITKDGVPTVGIMREKRNSIIMAGILRYRLIGHVPLPELAMTKLWANFQDKLVAYEAALDPALKPYSIVPSKVPSSTHA